MTIRVQILSFGSAWWVRPGSDMNDPERYTRHAAYFNSTGIEVGARIHTAGPVPGLVRFNSTSGLDPHRTHINVGRIFCFNEIERYRETNRLLALRREDDEARPTHFLVKVTSAQHGGIALGSSWCSGGVQTVAVSRFRGKQELLLLMTPESHIRTQLGTWKVHATGSGLPLLTLFDDPPNNRVGDASR